MKRLIISLFFAVFPAIGLTAVPGVRFDTVLSDAGKPIASQSVWVPFGQNAVIEVPGKVRIMVSAEQPTGEFSLVHATFYRSVAGKWVQDWNPSMKANLGETPSFERDMQGTTYRVVVMPRAANQPSSRGS